LLDFAAQQTMIVRQIARRRRVPAMSPAIRRELLLDASTEGISLQTHSI